MTVALWVCQRPNCGNQAHLASKADIAAQRSEMSGACGGPNTNYPGHAHPMWCSECQMRTAHVVEFVPSEKVKREFLAQVGLAPLARQNYQVNAFPLDKRIIAEPPQAPVPSNGGKAKDHLPVADVNWELLPAGSFEKQCGLLRAELEKSERASKPSRIFLDRLKFFENLQDPKPIQLLRGLGAFSRYFGVQFSDSLVALDNIHEGNAIYLMIEDWKILSQRSKTDLLATKEEGRSFIRIVHSSQWKARVQQVLTELLVEV